MVDILRLNKKLLIISGYAPPKKTGGPILLNNLFVNISKDDYCIFTRLGSLGKDKNRLDGKLGGKYYFFEGEPGSGRKISSWNIINKFTALFEFVSMISRGLKIISQENIELMMGLTDNGKSFLLTFIMSLISRKPYCIYLVDIYKGNRGGYSTPFWAFLSKFLEPILLKYAAFVFVVNPSFESHYKKIYPNIADKIQVINVCAITEDRNKSLSSTYESLPPYHIVYTGSISWPQEDSIISLIEAMNDIKDIDLLLDLYTMSDLPEKVLALVNKSDKINISVAGQNEIHKIQERASILFLPLSLNAPNNIVIETALPGKITEYLISGRPILIHASSSCYLAQYGKSNNCALVVDKKDREQLKEAIKKLIFDKEYVAQLIENAQKTFWANHDATKNSRLLVNRLNNI